jgi:predicted enzyme related to lactoylglutathione lyase
MPAKLHARLIGVELYFDDLQQGKSFYGDTLGLKLMDEDVSRYARFNAGETFLCIERKRSESYPSRDKAVIFFEVPDLKAAVDSVGRERILEMHLSSEGNRRPWAVMHDPEGYNILFVEAQHKS